MARQDFADKTMARLAEREHRRQQKEYNEMFKSADNVMATVAKRYHDEQQAYYESLFSGKEFDKYQKKHKVTNAHVQKRLQPGFLSELASDKKLLGGLGLAIGIVIKAFKTVANAAKNVTKTLTGLNKVTTANLNAREAIGTTKKADISDKVQDYVTTIYGTNTISNLKNVKLDKLLSKSDVFKAYVDDINTALTNSLVDSINQAGISSSAQVKIGQAAARLALAYAKTMNPDLEDKYLVLSDEYSEMYNKTVNAAINGGDLTGTGYSTTGWEGWAFKNLGYIPGVDYSPTAIADAKAKYLDEQISMYTQGASMNEVNKFINENMNMSRVLEHMEGTLYNFDEVVAVDAFSNADTIEEASKGIIGTMIDVDSNQTARDKNLQEQVDDMLSDGKITIDELKALWDQGYTDQQIAQAISNNTGQPIEDVKTGLENVKNQVAGDLGEDGKIYTALGDDGQICLYFKDLLQNGLPATKDLHGIPKYMLSPEAMNSGDWMLIGDYWYKVSEVKENARRKGIPTSPEELADDIDKQYKYGPKDKFKNNNNNDGGSSWQPGNILYDPTIEVPDITGSEILPGRKVMAPAGDTYIDYVPYKRAADGTWYPSTGIPGEAHGGIATAPTLAMVAEAGSDEAIIPLNSEGIGVLSQALQQAGGANSLSVNVNLDGINIADDDRRWEEVGRRIGSIIQNNLRRTGSM